MLSKKDKQATLPWVSDWTNPQDHYRYSRNYNAMDFQTWFWCTPVAYKIVMYGLFGIPIFLSVLVGLIINNSIVQTVFAAIAIIFTYLLIKQYLIFRKAPYVTLYDMFMLEKKEEEK